MLYKSNDSQYISSPFSGAKKHYYKTFILLVDKLNIIDFNM